MNSNISSSQPRTDWKLVLMRLFESLRGSQMDSLTRADLVSCTLLLSLNYQSVSSDSLANHAWRELVVGSHAKCRDMFSYAIRHVPGVHDDLRSALEELSHIGIKSMGDVELFHLIQSISVLPVQTDDTTRFQIGDACRELYADRGDWTECLSADVLSRLLVGLADPGVGDHVYDPFAGGGGTLLEAVKHLRKTHDRDECKRVSLRGCEINRMAWARAVVWFGIYGIPLQLEHGDAYLPRRVDQAPTIVLSDPPFSVRRDFGPLNSLAGRFFPGDAPPAVMDAFSCIYQVLSDLEPRRGRGFVVATPRTLFGGGAVERARRLLVERDLIEAVITLPKGMALPRTNISTCILVLNLEKRSRRRHGVLLIDGEGFSKSEGSGRAERARSVMGRFEREGIPAILEAFRTGETNPGFSIFASVEEIASHDWDLSPSRYMESPPERIEPVDLAALATEFVIPYSDVDDASKAFKDSVMSVINYLHDRREGTI